nr:hypothetical protein [Candidatus Sigynarchaeota archaeon]
MTYFMKSYKEYMKNLTLSQVPEYFMKKKEEGDAKKGSYFFVTQNLDDVYGEIANLDISWDETNPIRYHVGKESSILMNNVIESGTGFSEKKIVKVNGHDAYYLIGARKEARKSRVYMTACVLANFCCPQTKRKFVVKINAHKENFPGMEEHFLGIVMGIVCH